MYVEYKISTVNQCQLHKQLQGWLLAVIWCRLITFIIIAFIKISLLVFMTDEYVYMFTFI